MKVIKNIIAIILAVAILGGAAVGIGRLVTGSWDIRDWGKKTECVHVDEDNDGVCDKCKKEMPAEDEKQDETPKTAALSLTVPISMAMATTADSSSFSADRANLRDFWLKSVSGYSPERINGNFSYPYISTTYASSYVEKQNISPLYSMVTTPADNRPHYYPRQLTPTIYHHEGGLSDVDGSGCNVYGTDVYILGVNRYSADFFEIENASEYTLTKLYLVDEDGNIEYPIYEFNDYFAFYPRPSVPTGMTVRYEYSIVKDPVPLPPDPVKEGYTFVGWYYDEALTLPYDGASIYEDTELFAKWEINKYTVTFNSDGGSAVSIQKVAWNTAATLSTPTRDGYAFEHWCMSDGTEYTNQPITSDITLTAKWKRTRFVVTFDTNGGNEIPTQNVDLDNAVTLPTVTKLGCILVGWFLSDGTEYTNQPITGDITLTAHWEIIKLSVKFYVDGELYETLEVEYGTPLEKAASSINLAVMSVYSDSADFSIDGLNENGVTTEITVTAEKMDGVDKIVNTVKNNKWAVIGGVAGGVALIAIIAAVCSGVKRKKR